jgi:hypothetical protein
MSLPKLVATVVLVFAAVAPAAASPPPLPSPPTPLPPLLLWPLHLKHEGCGADALARGSGPASSVRIYVTL